jgi:hypothetical protein
MAGTTTGVDGICGLRVSSGVPGSQLSRCERKSLSNNLQDNGDGGYVLLLPALKDPFFAAAPDISESTSAGSEAIHT